MNNFFFEYIKTFFQFAVEKGKIFLFIIYFSHLKFQKILIFVPEMQPQKKTKKCLFKKLNIKNETFKRFSHRFDFFQFSKTRHTFKMSLILYPESLKKHILFYIFITRRQNVHSSFCMTQKSLLPPKKIKIRKANFLFLFCFCKILKYFE